MNIRRLIEIQAYRGIRHRRNLPVTASARTTNARTRKGPTPRRSRRQKQIRARR